MAMTNSIEGDVALPMFDFEVLEAAVVVCTELVEVAVTLLCCDVVTSEDVADRVVLNFDDVVTGAAMTERSIALYKLLSCASLTVTLQGLGNGVADAVTGQMLYPPTTEYVSTVL